MPIHKNVNLENKPIVTISLNPILEAFCRFIFKTPTESNEIAINLKEDIGLLIHSHILSTNCRPKRPSISNAVDIILPITLQNQYGLKSGFLYVSNWGLQKIENGVEYEFNKWVKRRFEIGYEKNRERTAIIEAILRGLNVRNNVVNFDAIKKNDYRNRRKTEEITFKELLEVDI